jgi:transposase
MEEELIMGRRWHCEWQHSQEELFQAYHQATDPRLRTRLQALWLLRGGRTLEAAASLTGVAYRTVQTWVAWYRRGGVADVCRHRQGGGAPAKLTAAQAEALKAQADTGAFRTRWDAIQWVREQYGIAYPYGGMRAVFLRLRLKKKVPRPQNPKASAEDQAAWKKKGFALNSTGSD